LFPKEFSLFSFFNSLTWFRANNWLRGEESLKLSSKLLGLPCKYTRKSLDFFHYSAVVDIEILLSNLLNCILLPLKSVKC
jgi:hypothetical protein